MSRSIRAQGYALVMANHVAVSGRLLKANRRQVVIEDFFGWHWVWPRSAVVRLTALDEDGFEIQRGIHRPRPSGGTEWGAHA